MEKIGIFFGTDSGTTRLIAKKIARMLGKRLDAAVEVAKPLNVNRIGADQFLGYRRLILGTPTYGDGLLPGKAAGTNEESWLEFLAQLQGLDFNGVRIALYGLGDQETYPRNFVDGMMELHRFFSAAGAVMVGDCANQGYCFEKSRALVNGRFVGLALDQHLQHLLTEQRIENWLDAMLPQLLEPLEVPRAALA
jgi:flavodoxin I